MEPREYGTMFGVEEHHWWYHGNHDLFLHFASRAISRSGPQARVLDAGCGTGMLLARLNHSGAVGLDFSALALDFTRRRGLRRLVRASAWQLPLADQSFDLVICNHVLAHLGRGNDLKALQEFHRVLRPGGRLLLAVPAFRFLWGEHDDAVHVKHRYRAGELASLVEQAGLVSEQISYYNLAILPPTWAVRLGQKVFGLRNDRPRSDLHTPPPWLNRRLTRLLLAENRWLKRGRSLPAGVSIFCQACRH